MMQSIADEKARKNRRQLEACSFDHILAEAMQQSLTDANNKRKRPVSPPPEQAGRCPSSTFVNATTALDCAVCHQPLPLQTDLTHIGIRCSRPGCKKVCAVDMGLRDGFVVMHDFCSQECRKADHKRRCQKLCGLPGCSKKVQQGEARSRYPDFCCDAHRTRAMTK